MKLKPLFSLLFLFTPELTYANAQLTLKFHIATVTSNKSLLGGTLQNTGDEILTSGFINYMVTQTPCVSGVIKTYYFNEISPGEKKTFRISIPEGLKAYKILSFGGVNSHGLPASIKDETAGVIKEKIDKEREYCTLKK
ncbi:hypothetical protein [Enterobacter mori]|uniref:hypothetical protein n=1 Tax=Enterobacter mori TaxID=539813 RepID=UPI002FD434B1